jgi:hypothetical protein
LRYRFARLMSFWARDRLLALPICSFAEFAGTQEASCVTDLSFWGVSGHARGFLRYRFARLMSLWARERLMHYRFAHLRSLWARDRLLALPICSFDEFLALERLLALPICRLMSFWARERLLALPICSFWEFAGTLEASCVTDLLV